MAELNRLKRTIAGTEQMGSVVGTMKALAAVNIHHYEKAAAAVERYSACIYAALHGLFRFYSSDLPGVRSVHREKPVLIICGAEQSMAGPFDEQLLNFVDKHIQKIAIAHDSPDIFVFGERMAGSLKTGGFRVVKSGDYPASLRNVSDSVYDIIASLDELRENRSVSRIEIFFNRPVSAGSHEPGYATLFPVDRSLVRSLAGRARDSRAAPLCAGNFNDVYRAILRNLIFTGIVRAFIDTLAAENAARLAAMQAAEKNITDRLSELRMVYNRERQSSITAELLDIVAGVEALQG
ncbi:MAG: hypothetical protein GF350_09855 [Chitinivibrionales bacterium]|nr:hypothetical protein [Chitinivibrionales bacterium]